MRELKIDTSLGISGAIRKVVKGETYYLDQDRGIYVRNPLKLEYIEKIKCENSTQELEGLSVEKNIFSMMTETTKNLISKFDMKTALKGL